MNNLTYDDTLKNIVDKVNQNNSELSTKYGTLGDSIRTQIGILNDGGLIMKEDFIGKQVNNWLSEHPEATTTVQDKSITTSKLADDVLNSISKTFDTVDDMKKSEYLKAGNYVKTVGYYYVNDGGGALYKIVSTKTNEYEEDLENGLYAVPINSGVANVKQFGAHGDNSNYDDEPFKKAIEFIKNTGGLLYIPKGVYRLKDKLTILWYSNNYWTKSFTKCKSFSIKGDGIYQSILKFESNNGLLIDASPTEYKDNLTSIYIEDFSIENSDFVDVAQAGGDRTPVDEKGIGLLLDITGYTSHVTRVGVRGFYIGIASRHCYDGPIFSSCFTQNCIFGFSSKDDTTTQYDSCNFEGLEAGFIQQGSSSVLTNCVSEGSVGPFKSNDYNQRSKFEGRGYVFINAISTLNGCYTEGVWGNGIYIENSTIVTNTMSISSYLNWYIPRAKEHPEEGYADMADWLEKNAHDYNSVYVKLNNSNVGLVKFIAPRLDAGASASINLYDSALGTGLNSNIAKTVIFDGVKNHQGAEKTFNDFYKGNAKPIVIVRTNEERVQNYQVSPINMLNPMKVTDLSNKNNYIGKLTFSATRKSPSFTNKSYDEVGLGVSTNLDGISSLHRLTYLNDNIVNDEEICEVSENGINFKKLNFENDTSNNVVTVYEDGEYFIKYVKYNKFVTLMGKIKGFDKNKYIIYEGIPLPITGLSFFAYKAIVEWEPPHVICGFDGSFKFPYTMTSSDFYTFSFSYIAK